MFEFLGHLGGWLFLLDLIVAISRVIYKFIKKYREYKDAYEYLKKKEQEEDDYNNVKSMGFKTKKEQEEIEAKLRERHRA